MHLNFRSLTLIMLSIILSHIAPVKSFVMQWCNNAMQSSIVNNFFTGRDEVVYPCLVKHDAHIEYTSQKTGITKKVVLKARNNSKEGLGEYFSVEKCLTELDDKEVSSLFSEDIHEGPYKVTVSIVTPNGRWPSTRTFNVNNDDYILMQPDQTLLSVQFHSIPLEHRKKLTCYPSQPSMFDKLLEIITFSRCRKERADIIPLENSPKIGEYHFNNEQIKRLKEAIS